MKAPIITNTGISGEAKLSDVLFAGPVNKKLLAQAILVYRSNLRQGTGASKTRSQITATTKKWYRQKGTGNARHGAKSAHIFVGGGVAHGPDGSANWSKKLTKKLKSKALVAALSAQADKVYVSSHLDELTGKTQEAVALLAPLQKEFKKILLVAHNASEKTLRAVRNIDNVLIVPAYQLTALEVSMAHAIVITPAALEVLEKRVLGISDIPVRKEENKTELPTSNSQATKAKKTTVKVVTTKKAAATKTKTKKTNATKKTKAK